MAALKIGDRFERLVVVEYEGIRNGARHWKCLCDCGNTREAPTSRLMSGNIKSCGCLQKEIRRTQNRRHGMSRTRTYNIWCGMITRCRPGQRSTSEHYYNKGIRVCERWQAFDNFLADMGECPDGMTIDRIDGAGGYEPGNCRWATAKAQRANNSQTVHLVTFNGETMNLLDWSRRLGIKYHTVYARYRRQLPLDQVFATTDLRH